MEEKNGFENMNVNDINDLIYMKEEESGVTLGIEHHRRQLRHLALIEYEVAKREGDNEDDIDAKRQSFDAALKSLNDASDAASEAQDEVIQLKLKKKIYLVLNQLQVELFVKT